MAHSCKAEIIPYFFIDDSGESHGVILQVSRSTLDSGLDVLGVGTCYATHPRYAGRSVSTSESADCVSYESIVGEGDI